jgi:cytochrome c-type biogenesis protein
VLAGELVTGFAIGIFATLSPCALPLYPGFLAYLAARRGEDASSRVAPWLGLVVLAGVLTTMLALGALMAALAVSTSSVLRIVTPLADVVVIALGIVLLLGRDPFAKLPVLGPARLGGGMVRSAYAYGLLYGPIALPCAAPLLVALFGLSLSFDSFVGALAFFIAFGLGFGLPLLAISLLAHSRQLSLVYFFARHHDVVSRVAGAVLVAVGAIDLANNVPLILLTL